MDLRPYLNRDDPARSSLFEQGVTLIQKGELWYQPFILADGLEVGEGQNLQDEYRNCESLFDNNVFLSDEYRHYWLNNPRKLAVDGNYFSYCNRKYRYCYELISSTIVSRMGDISKLSFLEIGCNTGLNLFNLATRGAASCTGIDWTDHSPVIGWLNRVLGTNVHFFRGTYDNLLHTIPNLEVPQSDVVINTVFLNHQCDPIQALCYFADHAKKGLFLWVLLDERGDELSVRYGHVSGIHDLGAGKPLPLSFHNDVRMSTALLTNCLQQLGFGEVEFVEFPPLEDDLMTTNLRAFRMVWARRTEDRWSGYEAIRAQTRVNDAGRSLMDVRRSYFYRMAHKMAVPVRVARETVAAIFRRD